MGADSEDLMDDILNAVQAELTQASGDNIVGRKGNTLATDLAVSSLVDELSGRFKVGVSVGNVGFDQSEHVDGGSVNLDEDAIVDLSQSEQTKDLDNLGGNSDGTADTDNEHNLALRGDEEGVVGLSLTARVDGSLLELQVSNNSGLAQPNNRTLSSTVNSYLLVLSGVLLGLGKDILLELSLVLQQHSTTHPVTHMNKTLELSLSHSLTLAAVAAAVAEALAKASFLACFFLNDSGTDDIFLFNQHQIIDNSDKSIPLTQPLSLPHSLTHSLTPPLTPSLTDLEPLRPEGSS